MNAILRMIIGLFQAQRFKEDSRESRMMSTVDDFIHSQRLGEDFDMFEDRYVF